MKQTLLDMTQNILSALSSDEVNSISDTTESMQVAQIIRNKYNDIVSRGELPEHKEWFQLDPSLDGTSPVLMYVPDGVSKIEWIKYFDTNTGFQTNTTQHDINVDLPDPEPHWSATSTTANAVSLGVKTFVLNDDMLDIKVGDFMVATSGPNVLYGTVTDYTNYDLTVNITNKIGAGTYSIWVINQNVNGQDPPGYQYVTILPIEQFVDYINSFSPSESDVASYTFTDSYNSINNNFTFYYKNSGTPRFCTVLSNYWVLFDSYDATQDVTLQASKTLCFGQIVPNFVMEDDFVPDLDDQQFPLLLNEAKSLAFFELKQQQHVKADQEIKRQWSTVQRNKATVNRPTNFDALPNFGGNVGAGWGRTFTRTRF